MIFMGKETKEISFDFVYLVTVKYEQRKLINLQHFFSRWGGESECIISNTKLPLC